MQVPFLDLKAQFESVKSEVMPAVEQVCASQMVCLGPAVENFEQSVAKYCGSKHAIGVSSGSDALLVSLMALEVGAGDEVITTPFTFFATAGAIARVGAKPVFVDIDPGSFNMATRDIASVVTPRTAAIMPVHLYGQICRMEPIIEVAAEYELAIVEDACQSIGAAQKDKKAGTFGQFGCFSFYPTKNLGAFGDAGLIVTDDEGLAKKAKMLRNHGQSSQYDYEFIGGNFRMDGIQGAVLDAKLKHLESWNEKRRANAEIYTEKFSGSPVKPPMVEPGNVHTYHQYTILAPKRDELKDYLNKKGVSSAVFYPKPLHLHKCYDYLEHREGDFPVAEQLSKEVLSLPIAPELSSEQIEYAADKVLEFYSKK